MIQPWLRNNKIVFMPYNNQYLDKIDQCLGDRIFTIRLRKNLSRQQLATAIGITTQQLYQDEKGMNRISVSRLFAVALALQVDLIAYATVWNKCNS